MPRAAKVKAPKSLVFTLGVASGKVYIANIEFCSPEVSDVWGLSLWASIELDETDTPAVKVFFVDQYGNVVPVLKSFATGGDIVTLVPEAVSEEVFELLRMERDGNNEMEGVSEEGDTNQSEEDFLEEVVDAVENYSDDEMEEDESD